MPPCDGPTTGNFGGTQGAIDNRALWEFIPSGLGSEVPTTCHRETLEALLAATAVIELVS